jgi:hypothetical protein
VTATIAYDLPVANFIDALSRTGHVTHRKYKKKSVTFHHNGGRLSLQGILDVWKTRPASAHFQSDSAGRIGQYVHVNEYAWATGNTTGNIESISIEMADLTLAPRWEIASVTWKSAARLAGWLFANVIKDAPTRENVFVHHHWKSTDCAGPFIDSIFKNLLLEVQVWYRFFTKPTTSLPSTDDWEAIMALFNTKEEFEASVAAGVRQGNQDYWRDFYKDEAGTGDAIWDDQRAAAAAARQGNLDLIAAIKENTEAVKANKPA